MSDEVNAHITWTYDDARCLQNDGYILLLFFFGFVFFGFAMKSCCLFVAY